MSKLFLTDEDLTDVVIMSTDFPVSQLQPQLLSCQEFVGRFTGEAVIERLTGKLADTAELTAVEKALLRRLRVPIANLALLRYARLRNVQLNTTGVQRTTTQGSGDAFEWQFNILAGQLESDAWEGLEQLHRFLEDKRDVFEEYSDSALFRQDAQGLIPNASEFNRYVFINESRLAFYALQSALRAVETNRIRPALGAMYATLVAGQNLTETQLDALEYARTALVHATMAKALRERVVEVGSQGVLVKSVSSFASLNYAKPADKETIDAAVRHHESECVKALNDLSSLIRPKPSTPVVTSGVRGGRGLTSF